MWKTNPEVLPRQSFRNNEFVESLNDVDIASRTECRSCQQVPLRPFVEEACNHVYCQACLLERERSEESSLCLCGGPHKVAQDGVQTSNLETLLIECACRHGGCEWVGPWKDLRSHLCECPYLLGTNFALLGRLSELLEQRPESEKIAFSQQMAPTHVVTGRGFQITRTVTVGYPESIYKTLQEALSDAVSGTKILLYPGTYVGPFNISSDVWICGATDAEAVVLIMPQTNLLSEYQQGEPLVQIDDRVVHAAITSVSLVCSSSSSALLITKSRTHLMVKDCVLKGTGSTLAGEEDAVVYIEGAGQERMLNGNVDFACEGVHLVGNEITKVQLCVSLGALAIIENNTIRGVDPSAVLVDGGSVAIIRNNEFADCRVGVSCKYHSTKMILEKNTFQNSTEAHVEVAVSEGFIIRNNSFDKSEGYGLVFDSDARGICDHNEIHNSFKAQIYIANNSWPTVKSCVLTDGNIGVLCTSGGCGLIQELTCVRHTIAQFHLTDKADPMISSCEISESTGNAVYSGSGARGYFHRCIITKNANPQIDLQGGCMTTFSECQISDGQGRALYAHDAACGILTNCEIYDHNRNVFLPLIDIDSLSTTQLLRNQIHGALSSAVLIHHSARPLIRENELFANRKCQIEVIDLADPVVESNIIRNAPSVAIHVHAKGKGTYENNTITDHTEGVAQVLLEDRAVVQFIGNTVANGAINGVIVRDKGTKAVLLRNRLEKNGRAQLIISGEAEVQVAENAICDALSMGICVNDKGTAPHITNNRIERSKDVQISVLSGANPTIEGNDIVDGTGKAVIFSLDSFGKFLANRVSRHLEDQVTIADRSVTVVRDNIITEGRACGLVITNAKPIVEHNEVSRNATVQIDVNRAAEPTIRSNKICEGSGVGIRVTEESGGWIENNEIYDHENAQIQIGTRARPIIGSNSIHDGRSYGVFLTDASAAILTGNDIARHALGQVVVLEGSLPVIKGCKIHHGTEHAILISGEGSSAVVENNEIFGQSSNNVPQIELEQGATATIRDNEIHHGEGPGLLLSTEATGTIEGNDIHHHYGAQIEIQSRSNPNIVDNRIHHGGSRGVWVHTAGKGMIHNNAMHHNDDDPVLCDTKADPVVGNNRFWSCVPRPPITVTRQPAETAATPTILHNFYGPPVQKVKPTTAGAQRFFLRDTPVGRITAGPSAPVTSTATLKKQKAVAAKSSAQLQRLENGWNRNFTSKRPEQGRPIMYDVAVGPEPTVPAQRTLGFRGGYKTREVELFSC